MRIQKENNEMERCQASRLNPLVHLFFYKLLIIESQKYSCGRKELRRAARIFPRTGAGEDPGATQEPGELYLLIKWQGCGQPDLVTAKEANINIPQVSFNNSCSTITQHLCTQVVIKYYEENVKLYDDDN